jgi:phospholipid/cholesterol/gamma-HCH transport system ATP-binding protein
MSVVGQLIRRLNDALGATSIIVTHDVVESLQIVDYLYFVADGKVVGEGTPAEIRASALPMVHQFVHGETDGPVPFHYPAPAYVEDVGLGGALAGAAHA